MINTYEHCRPVYLPYLVFLSMYTFFFSLKLYKEFFPIFAHNQNRMAYDLFEAIARLSACVNLLTNVRSSIIIRHFKIIYYSNFVEEEIYPKTLR